jgi:hypothetical protein
LMVLYGMVFHKMVDACLEVVLCVCATSGAHPPNDLKTLPSKKKIRQVH